MIRDQSSRKRISRGRLLLSFTVFLLSVFGTFLLHDSLYLMSRAEHNFPVSRVEIRGRLQHVSAAEVADGIGRFAGGQSLVTLDLEHVHNMLLQMPWIAGATVHKRYPDTVVVELREHYPSALWKNTGIYDASTRSVFYPDLKKFDGALIRLTAPHDSLAEELYEHASEFTVLLSRSPYHIEEVQLDASHGYRVIIQERVMLILGRESSPNLPLSRLQRFMLAFPHTGLSLKDVSYVDLRYDNGFAVGEKNAKTDEK